MFKTSKFVMSYDYIILCNECKSFVALFTGVLDPPHERKGSVS